MAYFAEIDNNKIVLRVLVVPDEQAHRGNDYLSNDLNLGGRWEQTFDNGTVRKNYAGIGFSFDEERDAFIPIKPINIDNEKENEYILDEKDCIWKQKIDKK